MKARERENYKVLKVFSFLVVQMVKNPPAMKETRFQSLAWEDPLEEGMAYSCLGNPMDRGAWWATVHAVAKSWTRLRTKQQQTVILVKYSP